MNSQKTITNSAGKLCPTFDWYYAIVRDGDKNTTSNDRLVMLPQGDQENKWMQV